MPAALLFSLVLLQTAAPPSAPQLSLVAEVSRFQLHSAFWPNLHHTLYAAAWSARPPGQGRPLSAPLPEPLAGELSAEERAAWDAAVQYYDRELASRDLLFGDGMTEINVALASAGNDLPESVLTPAHRRALIAAEPIYRKYWWTMHDRANRAWIAEAVPRVTEVAPEITRRLAELYRTPWFTSGVRVDVVRSGIAQGAYTSNEPATHITISSGNSSYSSWASVEMLYHEASHGLIDQISRRIREEAHGKDVRNLWHVVLFYTAGEVVRQALAARKIDYVPYLYATGLLDRAWPQFRGPVEREWRPYIDGQVTLEKAVTRLIAAIP
jgi:hypothetical protein